MSIESIFNETELAIFHRQTNFTFSVCYQSEDGTILAVDYASAQIFIGKDLMRSCLRDLKALESVSLDDGQTITLTFKEAPDVCVRLAEEDAEEVVSELQCLLEPVEGEEMPDPDEEESDEEDPMEDPLQSLGNKILTETYSRLMNTGRSRALSYLVESVGMEAKDACRYLDELEVKEDYVESVREPEYNIDGSMTMKHLLATVKELKAGDRVHVEFKPRIGRQRACDAEFRNIVIDTNSDLLNPFVSLLVKGEDFNSLVENTLDDLYDYMGITVLNEENGVEFSCFLRQVTLLRKL